MPKKNRFCAHMCGSMVESVCPWALLSRAESGWPIAWQIPRPAMPKAIPAMWLAVWMCLPTPPKSRRVREERGDPEGNRKGRDERDFGLVNLGGLGV